MPQETPDPPEDTGDESTWSLDDDAISDTDWVPPAVDDTKPSVARMYDYYLGGKDNFAVDREAAGKVMALMPDARDISRVNREFLVLAVRTMAAAGVRQFIDLGTGIPTSPNVHETARAVHPDAAVVYVDNDPAVMAHNRALLSRHPRVITVPHDLREPRAVLDDPAVRRVIDFTRPVGRLFIAVLHFVDHGTAPEVVDRYLRPLVPGSHVAISTATRDGVDPEVVRRVEAVYSGATAPFVYRTQPQAEALFDDLDLLPPGVVDVYEWTKGTPSLSPTVRGLAGIGVKRP